MQFIFKDNTYTIPTSLSEITLGQRINFQEQYGEEIAKREALINAIEDKIERDLERADHYMYIFCISFSFFSGIDIHTVKEEVNIYQIIELFLPCFQGLFEQQEQITLQSTYYFKDEVWELASPELNYKSAITFGEFVTAKQIIKSLYDLSKDNWTALQYLCAIFLRKKSEAFDESFATEDSERFKLMRELPMDIALSVAFFLNASSSIYQKPSLYSKQAEEGLQN